MAGRAVSRAIDHAPPKGTGPTCRPQDEEVMMSRTAPGSTIDDVIELVPISGAAWRVCDPRYSDGGGRRILGYLREEGGEVEMMWMRPRPGVCYRYETLDGALHAVRLRLRHLQ
jgi:hypothetical protein